jgi:hypothetical protein
MEIKCLIILFGKLSSSREPKSHFNAPRRLKQIAENRSANLFGREKYAGMIGIRMTVARESLGLEWKILRVLHCETVNVNEFVWNVEDEAAMLARGCLLHLAFRNGKRQTM